VSLIDPEFLKKMPQPKPGDYLIAIRRPDSPTFRSNGITKMRTGLRELYGKDWHKKDFAGQNLGELAETPSTIFYPVFTDMLQEGLATGVYHMSGGAHNGKLARPLAKYGLHADIANPFEPPALMNRLVKHFKLKPEEAYEIWNMGNEGYVAVPDARVFEAVEFLKQRSLEPRVVGKIREEAGKTGVTIHTKSTKVYYSGK
jgi:phosphoribosylformylglycinamidine cyclo-ligase